MRCSRPVRVRLKGEYDRFDCLDRRLCLQTFPNHLLSTTIAVYSLTTLANVPGYPAVLYFHGYSTFDCPDGHPYTSNWAYHRWRYHRSDFHKSFLESHPLVVKFILLIMGGWALQNSALIWCADHIRHHAHTDEESDPYNAEGILV
ncbi:MAG: hypothetical protein U0231_16585 [Nitrospiraceae bacterium]